MRYLIRAEFNGRVTYLYADNLRDAQYAFDMIAADLTNGDVGLWTGNRCIDYCAKADGKKVA